MPGKNQMTSVFAQPSPRFRVSSPEQRAGKATHEAGYKPAIEAADAPATEVGKGPAILPDKTHMPGGQK